VLSLAARCAWARRCWRVRAVPALTLSPQQKAAARCCYGRGMSCVCAHVLREVTACALALQATVSLISFALCAAGVPLEHIEIWAMAKRCHRHVHTYVCRWCAEACSR
jgi:hypothetical protein